MVKLFGKFNVARNGDIDSGCGARGDWIARQLLDDSAFIQYCLNCLLYQVFYAPDNEGNCPFDYGTDEISIAADADGDVIITVSTLDTDIDTVLNRINYFLEDYDILQDYNFIGAVGSHLYGMENKTLFNSLPEEDKEKWFEGDFFRKYVTQYS